MLVNVCALAHEMGGGGNEVLTRYKFVPSDICWRALGHEYIGFCTRCQWSGISDGWRLLAIKKNHGIPLSGHFEHFLYFRS